jgi:hypothetical protein
MRKLRQQTKKTRVKYPCGSAYVNSKLESTWETEQIWYPPPEAAEAQDHGQNGAPRGA